MIHSIDALRIVNASDQAPGTLLVAYGPDRNPPLLVMIAARRPDNVPVAVSLDGPRPYRLSLLNGISGIPCPKVENPRIELPDALSDDRNQPGMLAINSDGAWMPVRVEVMGGSYTTAFLKLDDSTVHDDVELHGAKWFDRWQLLGGPTDSPQVVLDVERWVDPDFR